jgi:hypothetical protein
VAGGRGAPRVERSSRITPVGHQGSCVPELLQRTRSDGRSRFEATAPLGHPRVADERALREELRRQIASLEARLGRVFVSAFPRRGIEWRVGAVGGPRVLGVAELERVRDSLAFRLREAETELSRRGAVEEANRGLLEELIAEPERHHWVRVANEDIGEPGCRHWHSRPRWGLLGMLLGWWRVKLSSGCPLASGRGLTAASRPKRRRLRPATAADLEP